MSTPAELPSADYSGRQTLTVPIQTTGSSHNSSPRSGDSGRIAHPYDNSPTPRLVSGLSQPYENHSSASSGPDLHSPSQADFPEAAEPIQDQAQEIYGHEASTDRLDDYNNATLLPTTLPGALRAAW